MIILLFSRFTLFFFVSMSWRNIKKWKPCTYFWLLYVWFCPGRCWKHWEQVVLRKKKNQLKNPHPNLLWKKSPVKSWPKYLTTMMRYCNIAHFHEKKYMYYKLIFLFIISCKKKVLVLFYEDDKSPKTKKIVTTLEKLEFKEYPDLPFIRCSDTAEASAFGI